LASKAGTMEAVEMELHKATATAKRRLATVALAIALAET